MWQVILHSAVATAALALWSRRLRVHSGRARRLVLVTVLALPLVTAAVPGRGDSFRHQLAWLDSQRLVALPLGIGDLRLWHLILAVVAVALAAGLWQELLGALHHHPRVEGPASPSLQRFARRLPGWEGVVVTVAPVDDLALATSGWPGRPRLNLSRGTLERLTPEELRVALRHENAHWRRGRWWLTHGLFLVRLVQLFNPVALWSFREYVVETEIACDRDAVGGGDPRPLARALLKVYRDTDRHDVATRRVLRRRVDALLGRLPVDDRRPPVGAVAAVAALLAGVLPWLV